MGARQLFPTVFFLVIVAFIDGVPSALAVENERSTLEYNRDIRPILAENCFACHGLDAMSREADLRLDERDAAIEMGAITPGEATASELVARIDATDPDILMPPPGSHKSLTDEQKEMLTQWIDEGAKYEPHWSLMAPQKRAPPLVAENDWPNNAIDHFVLAKLEANGMTPSIQANPRRLFRRLHLDVTGLPPSPDDVAEFVGDFSARGHDACSDWIDRLMATTAWGEHRARYWLDAARYADTHGLHFDNYREIWPYRDWVIRAFNANQPFDQFVVEQIAGDLLEEPTRDQLIATGFQRCNITTNEGGTIKEENLAIYAADRVQTFGWVFLGLTTNCCQCHDHKFDPLSAKDYYSLAAFFRNTTQPALDGNEKRGGGPALVLPSEEDALRYEELPGEIAALETELEERRRSAPLDYHEWRKSKLPQLVTTGAADDALVAHALLTSATSANSEGDQSSVVASATGEFEWSESGPVGPAAKLSKESTFDLGDLANIARDQPFSVGAWVRPPKTSNGKTVFGRMKGKKSRGWDLYIHGGIYAFHLVDAWPKSALKVVTKGNVVTPNAWQHLFITYDGSGKAAGVRLYIDGQSRPTRTATETLKEDATTTNDAHLRIGQRTQGNVFEGGFVQDFRLYDRLLTGEEVAQVSRQVVLQTAQRSVYAELTLQQQDELFTYFLMHQDAQFIALAKQHEKLKAEIDQIRARSPVTLVQKEKKDSPAMAHVLMRGAYDQLGEKVAANTPAILPPLPAGAPANRLGLAQWLVEPSHPLFARVTVNRFWQELFGKGLVATPEDFGVMGAPPTHPELLDWLAVDFRESGWDVKRLFKLMLMSATYRQSPKVTPDHLERDRDNDLLSRGPRFRMDGEMIRDYALQVSGQLSPKMYGPGVRPYQPDNIWNIVGLPGGDTREYKQDTGESLYRRSLYTFWKRMAPHPTFESFNAPSRELCTVRRERTNTPLQALITLNDTQFVEAARNLAQRLFEHDEKTIDRSDDDRLTEAAGLVLGRPFTEPERKVLLASKERLEAYFTENEEAAAELIQVGESKIEDDIRSAQLATWTMLCNQLLNLDEALTK
jgi:cytochrome c553